MKEFSGIAAALAFIAALFVGCHSTDLNTAATPGGKLQARNNAASLLFDLLNDEKNVGKLLIIKRDRAELHRVIKSISTEAADGAKKLEEIGRHDATLNLRAPDLPAGEQMTRDSIAKAHTGELLRASGDDFEFKLLLTQAEALSYGTHLAKIAALNEPDAGRARVFSNLSTNFQQFHDEVLKLMRSRTVPVK